VKLIIDRGSTIEGIYRVEYGVDFDVMIGYWDFHMQLINSKTMSEIDMIITKSVELKNCVLYMKHPLLLENTTEDFSDQKGFFNTFEEVSVRKNLRNFFAVRLTHRRYQVDLIDLGRRLF
jgi:hypothetical protein